MVTNEWEERWTFSPFPGLLADAIAFDGDANQDTEAFDFRNRLAKASFACAVLALESAANSCLARMQYPESVRVQLDKAQPLDKFTMLADASGHLLDKGRREVQAARELMGLRNSYVHPKIQDRSLKMRLNDQGERVYDHLDDELTQYLQLPRDFERWHGVHSRAAVRATIEFLNYFFMDLCRLSMEQASSLLCIFARGPVNSSTMLVPSQSDLILTASRTYGHAIRFIRLGVVDEVKDLGRNDQCWCGSGKKFKKCHGA